MNSTANRTTTSDCRTMCINGSLSFQKPRKGALVIGHRQALNLILAAETGGGFDPHRREELPAIVSHWLQSPKDPPLLLDASYSDKWLELLRNWCSLETSSPAAGLPKRTSHPRPVHIDFSGVPFTPVERPKFTFIDLFAGIGGFRIALQHKELGGKCVFSSEWDRHAKETYYENYGEVPFGDITRLSSLRLVPRDLDVVAGGFPCQPFSRAGVSAREFLGQKHGFECEAQGQLFFDVLKLAKTHRPRLLLLENVGNLLRHDGGHTFQVIRENIEKSLGYKFYHKIYNANTLVPQNRVRCIIVAFREPPCRGWEMPELTGEPRALKEILNQNLPVDSSYTLTEKMWLGHIRRSDRNVARGTGFTAYVKDLDRPSTTLVARYYKDGKECLIPQPKHPRGLPRMLTEVECAKLQGFPEGFRPHPSRIHAYKQFGNAVPVPLVAFVAKAALKAL